MLFHICKKLSNSLFSQPDKPTYVINLTRSSSSFSRCRNGNIKVNEPSRQNSYLSEKHANLLTVETKILHLAGKLHRIIKATVNNHDTTSKIHCHECALAVTVGPLTVNQKAQCPRCGFTLTVLHCNAIERIIALSLTALVFLCLSLPFEFLSFKSNGLENKFDVTASFSILIDSGYQMLALIELLTIFVIPITVLSCLIYLLIPLSQGYYPAHARFLLNLVFKLLPWSMVEIFLIGALVSLIKIISIADIHLGPSFFAFILISISMTTVVLHIDKNQLYNLLRSAQNSPERIRTSSSEQAKIEKHSISDSKVIEFSNLGNDEQHQDKSNPFSVQKTWALILTAIVLYVPANTLPIMTTRVLGQDEPSTILGGVTILWSMGSYPIAAIIFIASVVVPIAKILVLAWLNYSVQQQSNTLNSERMKLYRIAEFVGRWSMVDVFVVIILVCLIQLGQTMSISPGVAAVAFSGVVVITMLAAMSFEPQLIWNSVKKNEK
jgi:paraquat-inducible protein A